MHTVWTCNDALVTRYGVHKVDTGIIDSARRHAVVRARDKVSYESSFKRFELAFRFAYHGCLLSTKQNLRTIRRCVGRRRAPVLIAGVA